MKTAPFTTMAFLTHKEIILQKKPQTSNNLKTRRFTPSKPQEDKLTSKPYGKYIDRLLSDIIDLSKSSENKKVEKYQYSLKTPSELPWYGCLDYTDDATLLVVGFQPVELKLQQESAQTTFSLGFQVSGIKAEFLVMKSESDLKIRGGAGIWAIEEQTEVLLGVEAYITDASKTSLYGRINTPDFSTELNSFGANIRHGIDPHTYCNMEYSWQELLPLVEKGYLKGSTQTIADAWEHMTVNLDKPPGYFERLEFLNQKKLGS